MASPFAQKLADIAQKEFEDFHDFRENQSPLSDRIIHYYDKLGFPFESTTTVPWSAVYISYCVKEAGATASEFKFDMAHAKFVKKAIQNADNGQGVFQAFRLSERAVHVGDIIQNNRGLNITFAVARVRDDYISHSVIVVERGVDSQGNKFAVGIGGNESNSIRRTRIALNADGTVKQRSAGSTEKFICIIKNLKT